MNTSNIPSDQSGKSASRGVEPVLDEARHAVDDVATEAKNVAREAQARISGVADEATQQAKTFAEENKSKIADQATAFSGALEKAAEELERSDQAAIARYARDVARGIDDMSSTLRDRGVDDLLYSLQDFARRQPATFLGAAALAGFAASRFMRASASRAQAHSAHASTGSDYSSMATTSSSYPDGYSDSPDSGLGTADAGIGRRDPDLAAPEGLGDDLEHGGDADWRGTANYQQTERGH